MALQAIDAPDFDHLFKVLLIGDSGTGKSNILLRFADDRFKEDIGSTIGVDFKVCTRHVQGKVIKMYLWDTAGQERFRTITSSYYRGSHGIVVAYDITERASFEHVRMWIQEIVKYANNSVKVMLVGNKTDLAEKRAVSTDEGFLLAEELGVRFLETSALSARNVENAFGLLIQDMVAAAYMERPLSQQHQSLGLKDGKSSARPGQAVCCV